MANKLPAQVVHIITLPACTSNSDCTNGYCRPAQKTSATGSITCDTAKECVPWREEGQACSGEVLPCNEGVCKPGLTCILPQDGLDEPGVCKLQTPKSCTSDSDCTDGYCRTAKKATDSGSSPQCDNDKKECVVWQPAGATCGGFTLPCFFTKCGPGYTCQGDALMADGPGTCQKTKTTTPTTGSTGSRKCPTVAKDGAGICVEDCTGDEDCTREGEMCCSNGCGHTCQPSVEATSKLVCPTLPPDTVGACAEECSQDDDCTGGMLCCSNGCGHSCSTGVDQNGNPPTDKKCTTAPDTKREGLKVVKAPEDSEYPVAAGTEIEFKCEDEFGMRLKGDNPAKCQADGTWTTLPVCNEKAPEDAILACDRIEKCLSDDAGGCTVAKLLHGDDAQCKCGKTIVACSKSSYNAPSPFKEESELELHCYNTAEALCRKLRDGQGCGGISCAWEGGASAPRPLSSWLLFLLLAVPLVLIV
eukprot:TRINITY_DN61146_c0_g2_i1.p1 TRINITY_DN61146_c0_g2~~TRINITY_DN61146_c0_g2_i1.p1  ORF type:complete len:474 (-),score=57.31 TRINITY_DN61146_c0_g2_i1:161-1582(-)